jgi:D-arabinose 1-dehydrogenase-like Zn-dependent alcohol dehydrogenase
LPSVNAFTLINGGFKLSGSAIGSPGEIEEMLHRAVEFDIKPWVELRPLTDANQAILDMEAGKTRYRYVLVNEKHLDA